jgi:hypothetical protein
MNKKDRQTAPRISDRPPKPSLPPRPSSSVKELLPQDLPQPSPPPTKPFLPNQLNYLFDSSLKYLSDLFLSLPLPKPSIHPQKTISEIQK